jgi:hypothetical protein
MDMKWQQAAFQEAQPRNLVEVTAATAGLAVVVVVTRYCPAAAAAEDVVAVVAAADQLGLA